MKNAEVDHGKLDAARAIGSHTKAVQQLRTALMAFPMNIAEIIAEGLDVQQGALSLTESLIESTRAASGVSPEGAPDPADAPTSGMGKVMLDALKDKVLQPVARFLAPRPVDESNAIADEQEDVIWAAAIVAQAVIPPTPPQPHGPVPGGPGPAPQPAPALDEEQARLLSEALQAEGQNALTASTAAREKLAAVELALFNSSETCCGCWREQLFRISCWRSSFGW